MKVPIIFILLSCVCCLQRSSPFGRAKIITGIEPNTVPYQSFGDQASSTETDYNLTYYYTDEYFAESSFNYNPQLATMSMAMAFTAFASHFDDPGPSPYIHKNRK